MLTHNDRTAMTSPRFRPTCVALVLGLSLLSCSNDSTTPTPVPDSPVTVESSNSVSKTIGPEGGMLQTTANDGTVYTLTIPANSIPTGKKITMTPVTAIDGYPIAGGLAGGVELKPSGTIFAAPVTLTIETTKTPDAGEKPVAILFSGSTPAFEPSFAGFSGGTLTIPMTHFSGGTAGFATAQELETLVNGGTATCLEPAIGQLPDDVNGAIATYRSCFTSDVLPALENATNDTQLATAIGLYSMWKTESRLALSMPAFDDAAETTQWTNALVGKLQGAIDRNNQGCETNQSLAALANVLFWQTQAARFGVATVPNLLDRDHVLSSLCARPVIDEIVIPPAMQVGFPHSIDIQLGLLFNGQGDSQGVPFKVHLTGDGVNVQHPEGFTDAQGKYTTVITATRDDSLRVTAHACFILPGTQVESDLCIDGAGDSQGINLNGTWTGTVTNASFPVCFTLTQNQNAISGTIQQFGGTATITATLAGSQLLNVTIDGFFGEANCVTTGTGSLSNGTLTIAVTPQAPCNSNVTIPYTLTKGTCAP